MKHHDTTDRFTAQAVNLFPQPSSLKASNPGAAVEGFDARPGVVVDGRVLAALAPGPRSAPGTARSPYPGNSSTRCPTEVANLSVVS
jgi:hypothetical protein